MKYTQDGTLLAVASSGGQIYIHDAKDHYSLKTTTREYIPQTLISSQAEPPHSAAWTSIRQRGCVRQSAIMSTFCKIGVAGLSLTSNGRNGIARGCVRSVFTSTFSSTSEHTRFFFPTKVFEYCQCLHRRVHMYISLARGIVKGEGANGRYNPYVTSQKSIPVLRDNRIRANEARRKWCEPPPPYPSSPLLPPFPPLPPLRRAVLTSNVYSHA